MPPVEQTVQIEYGQYVPVDVKYHITYSFLLYSTRGPCPRKPDRVLQASPDCKWPRAESACTARLGMRALNKQPVIDYPQALKKQPVPE